MPPVRHSATGAAGPSNFDKGKSLPLAPPTTLVGALANLSAAKMGAMMGGSMFLTSLEERLLIMLTLLQKRLG